ncbi:MAG TPA: adenosylcobalamin-dependent ribonucleoside-diphosphate reductase, partial [Alphaproteobacteria bacterium]|nr:adenosylcobalamin-dependent ribonucleoside-diphosphate reductase [Alphaproteobacteria bacterium]
MTELTPSALEVLRRRYLCRGPDGEPCETAEEMMRRVARHVASAESAFGGDAKAWEKRFFEALGSLSFLPNSPTLMNAGRAYGQLSACFVLPVPDDIPGIFDTIKLAAVIHQTGGGTGFSFSRLRPRGDLVATSGGSASGPISFMRVFNEATEAINQGGFRRGANMAVLCFYHPDVVDFIRCKAEEGAFANFNISVGVTEELFRLAEAGEAFDLINPHTGGAAGRMDAAALLREAASCAWRGGEPGLVFLDRLNRDNPVPSLGQIETTNPCGEQPLLPYESCNLGSVNLSGLVKGGGVDWERLGALVELGVRFLDDVVEVNRYPDPHIASVTLGNRKIGLGVMGFADLLIRLSIPYDSEEALSLARELMAAVSEHAMKATIELADERGAFPNFVKSELVDSPPVRNATTTTIAPTGTISMIAGCSSGIEPLYALAVAKRVLEGEQL